MLDLARFVRFRWHLHPKIAVGDAKFGTTNTSVGLEQDGLHAYVATADYSQRTSVYTLARFRYDAEQEATSVRKVNSCRYPVSTNTTKRSWTVPHPKSVTLAQSKPNVLPRRWVVSCAGLSLTTISTACEAIMPRPLTRRQCASGRCGLNRFLAKPNNGTPWSNFACGVW